MFCFACLYELPLFSKDYLDLRTGRYYCNHCREIIKDLVEEEEYKRARQGIPEVLAIGFDDLVESSAYYYRDI